MDTTSLTDNIPWLTLSLDESEIKLSCGIKKPDFTQELAKLKRPWGKVLLAYPGFGRDDWNRN